MWSVPWVVGSLALCCFAVAPPPSFASSEMTDSENDERGVVCVAFLVPFWITISSHHGNARGVRDGEDGERVVTGGRGE